MFGYIMANEPEMKVKERDQYRSFYCGLCRSLYHRYGRAAQLLLNYDMTFLAVLLTGLYESDTQILSGRCLMHPALPHTLRTNEAVEYAADMTVLLSWYKLEDDWEDEKKMGPHLLAELLKKDLGRLQKMYPRQSKALEESLALLHQAEKSNDRDPDRVAGYTGRFLAEIFNWQDDIWKDELRRVGFYLGKFIYLMDAIEDCEKDQKKGNYNLFAVEGDIWKTGQLQKKYDLLTQMMAEAASAFEHLPILSYAEILRNILYSGVWCRLAKLKSDHERNRE